MAPNGAGELADYPLLSGWCGR